MGCILVDPIAEVPRDTLTEEEFKSACEAAGGTMFVNVALPGNDGGTFTRVCAKATYPSINFGECPEGQSCGVRVVRIGGIRTLETYCRSRVVLTQDTGEVAVPGVQPEGVADGL